MLRPLTACCTFLLITSPLLLASGCAPAPPIAPGRTFESIEPNPSSPDSTFGVSGTKDSSNGYLSTLRILWPEGACSGVLIAERAVLTSAHCFCLPLDFTSTARIYDISDCRKNAPAEVEVFTVYYQGTGRTKDDIPISGKGSVIVHESFKSEIRNGAIQSHQADIAIIRLKDPLTFEWKGTKRTVEPERELAEHDVSLGEVLTIAGYGPYVYGSREAGVRRFGTNTVTDIEYSSRPIPASSSGLVDKRVSTGKREFRFRAEGSHTRAGDSGGPCFRIEGNKRWLAGINGGHANQGAESWFTSVFPYKAWIEEQKTLIETR